MKRNVVAFLSKEGLGISDIQNKKKQFKTYFLDKNIENDLVLCLKNKSYKADWADLFSSYDIDDSDFEQQSVQGIFFVKVDNRYVVFTFGYGRGLIEKSSIERGFGLRVAMDLGDPEQLKSVDKSTLDRVARNTRSQLSLNSSIQDFDFEFDHEILKSITAIVKRNDDELEMVSGNDSVSLYTEIKPELFHELANRLVDAYLSKNYKEKYPWAEFIGLETDPQIISILEDTLVGRFNRRELEGFWLSPPRIINYEDFSGFAYTKKSNGLDSPCRHPELNLKAFLEEASFKNNKKITIGAVKAKEIYLMNNDYCQIDTVKFFEALNGELDFDNKKYILNDGYWYHIKNTFAEEVISFFDTKIPRWNGLESKVYYDKKECCYLRRIADGESIAVLDQHWVRNKGMKQNYEFCDLLTQCGRIIHVKHYGGSSVLSHLFAQATNGMEMMLNSPEVIPQVQEHLENTYISFDFDPSKPRKYKIVLAVIQEKAGDIHLPFFPKVNLRHHVRDMQNKGFTVELAKIQVDKLKLSDTLSQNIKCGCKSKTAKCTSELTENY